MVTQLSPVAKDRWHRFVDEVIDQCPSISTTEVEQVASILARLEQATSQYSLINRLHSLKVGDLEELDQLLTNWTVRTAKVALDEVQSRLRLIEELDQKLRDDTADEVRDLQPLFERSLWVFGPEYESLEFTSNRGMTQVIQKLFGSTETGSRLRPEFVMLPDGSVGFYARDHHDWAREVSGVASLVVAEIKKRGVVIGSEQRDQAWRYVKELIPRGFVTRATDVICFVLGSVIDETEAGERVEWDDRVRIRPTSYDTFIRRAETRMLGLRQKLKDPRFYSNTVSTLRTPLHPEDFSKSWNSSSNHCCAALPSLGREQPDPETHDDQTPLCVDPHIGLGIGRPI